MKLVIELDPIDPLGMLVLERYEAAELAGRATAPQWHGIADDERKAEELELQRRGFLRGRFNDGGAFFYTVTELGWAALHAQRQQSIVS